MIKKVIDADVFQYNLLVGILWVMVKMRLTMLEFQETPAIFAQERIRTLQVRHLVRVISGFI
jgi:hypothetical protein